MKTTKRTTSGAASGATAVDDAISQQVSDTVHEQPWVKHLARAGWVAKGVVYVLMGLTAFAIGRRKPSDDEASPEGALGQVVSSPGGKVLLGVLAVGLALYAVWRLLSTALVHGGEAKDWVDRIGYLFSATFYGLLAFTAGNVALSDAQPGNSNTAHSNTVEDASKAMLESSIGRWALLLAGLVTMGLGVYFIVQKGINTSFLEELSFKGASTEERRFITTAGRVGWMGRGLVTTAVGFFVTKAAWEVDRDDARGFDRALRELAAHAQGRFVVLAVGVGLIAYGVFCILSFRYQELED